MMKLVKLFVILFMLYLYLVCFFFNFFYKAEPFKVVLHSSYNILFYDLFFFLLLSESSSKNTTFLKKTAGQS